MSTEQLRNLLAEAESRRLAGKQEHDCHKLFAPAYEALGVPHRVRKVAHELRPEVCQDTWLPFLFPPCGIPLWGDSHLFTYEWRHWFLDRQAVIVRVDPEQARAWEWARNYSQLGYLIAQDELVASDEPSQDFEEICEILEIEDREVVINLWQEQGDLRSAFASHQVFANDLPQSCLLGDYGHYSGDFPAPKTGQPADFRRACSFEVSNIFRDHDGNRALMDQVRASSASPSWLRTMDQARIFSQLFERKDWMGAWLSLCSTGWQYGEAKIAADRLAEAHDDVRFKIQVACWCSLPFEDNIQY